MKKTRVDVVRRSGKTTFELEGRVLGNDFPESAISTLAEGPLDVLCVTTGSGMWVTRISVPADVSNALARISIKSVEDAQNVLQLVSTLSHEVHHLTPAVLEPFIRSLVWLGEEDMAAEVLGWTPEESSNRGVLEDAMADAKATSSFKTTTPEVLSASEAERLRTLAGLVAQKKLKMNSPLPRTAAVAFEENNQVRLPAAYREFLCQIGNGGDAMGHRLLALPKSAAAVKRPFPLRDEVEDIDWHHMHDGILPLVRANETCDQTNLFLVVSGKSRGRVWSIDRNLDVARPHADFLDWCIAWFDHGDLDRVASEN